MMNKIIKEQLLKINNLIIDENSTEIFIPKQLPPGEFPTMSIGKCFELYVKDYIIHPYDGFTLHDNWNQGRIPTDNHMNCEILEQMGKMIRVHTIGIDDNSVWDGWLPMESCTFKEL